MLHYYIVDTETTGLKAGYHEVIQISIIRYSDRFQRTLNIKAEFPFRASKEALQITGKSIHDIQKGIGKPEAVEELENFLSEDQKTSGHRCIVAHNAVFDRRMLHAMWQSLGRKFPADLWLCTKEFTRKFAKKRGIEKPKLTLAASLELTGIVSKRGAHNAVIDTLNTTNLFEKLMGEQLDHVHLIKRVPHDVA
jgi:DNA polymerase III epsilon subunit-like protein